MATEMASRSKTRSKDKDQRLTMWEVFERAAKAKYGNRIKVVKAPWATKQVNNLEFEVEVVDQDPEPIEKTRITADINMKEYINRSDKDADETIVRISKKKSKSQGNRYRFSSTKGVNWGVGGNIGAQVMGLATVGGSASFGGNYGKSKSTTTENEETEALTSEFCYEQEEKIVVPARSKVCAKITSYVMKYEQGYKLKLSLPKSLSLNVLYKNRFHQLCCCSTLGKITAANLLDGLQGCSEEDDTVSITQDGTLSWIGEGSKIDKVVEPLMQSSM